MTKKSINNILCLIMTVMMLFSGMCTKQTSADSHFSYSDSLTSSILDGADDLTGYPIFLTEEGTPSRVLSNTIRSNHRQGNNTRTEMVISVANTICIFSATYSFVADIQAKPFTDSTAALIYYIQQKDGKK